MQHSSRQILTTRIHKSTFTVSILNVNGWTETNGQLREDIINYISSDIFGIVETHLTGDKNINVPTPGLDLIEPCKIKELKKSPVVLGLFVKNTFKPHFYVKAIDKSYDGILAFEFNHKKQDFKFIVILCYLPPEGSVYANSTEFFSDLVSLVYQFNECNQVYIGGDFNARIGSCHDILVLLIAQCLTETLILQKTVMETYILIF